MGAYPNIWFYRPYLSTQLSYCSVNLIGTEVTLSSGAGSNRQRQTSTEHSLLQGEVKRENCC